MRRDGIEDWHGEICLRCLGWTGGFLCRHRRDLADWWERRNGIGEKNERGRQYRTPRRGGARAVKGFDSFWCGGGFALGGLLAVCPEHDVGLLVHASVTEMKSFEAADVVNDVVEKVKVETS